MDKRKKKTFFQVVITANELKNQEL